MSHFLKHKTEAVQWLMHQIRLEQMISNSSNIPHRIPVNYRIEIPRNDQSLRQNSYSDQWTDRCQIANSGISGCLPWRVYSAYRSWANFLPCRPVFSRDHIYPGMMTLHPSGIPHGPHPKALQNAGEKRRTMTDEVAVMIDTREALEISKQAEAIEWADYVDSWKWSSPPSEPQAGCYRANPA